MVSFTAYNSESEFHRIKRLIDVYQFVCNMNDVNVLERVEALHDHKGHLTVSIHPSSLPPAVDSIESMFKEAWKAFREDMENVSLKLA